MSLGSDSRQNPAASTAMDSLLRRIEDRSAVVGVVGLGYMGLPLAIEKCKIGFRVVGVEQNPTRAQGINRGISHSRDVSSSDLKAMVDKGKITAYPSFECLREADVILICVTMPLTRNKEPDTSYIQVISEEISKYLKQGQLVVLESTTYPGTTEEIILPRLEKSGLKVGRDFFLAYAPERADSGTKRYTTKNSFKIIGGVTENCLKAALGFYKHTVVNLIPMTSPRVAEMTKVFENVFRAVNIALVNELSILCNKMGIDVYEVIDAAATKNFGFMPFYPGPGVGGHCTRLDPYYLAWKSKAYDQHTRFIELAGELNESMPYRVIYKVIETLNAIKRPLKNAQIVLFGVAYKKNIEDWRESPAIRILELLEGYGAKVVSVDPFITDFADRTGKKKWKTVPYSKDLLKNCDLALITTDHADFPYEEILKHSPLVVDTRNATKFALETLGVEYVNKVVKLSTTLNQHDIEKNSFYASNIKL